MYKLLDARESAKRSGISWLKKVDNTTFCQSIEPFIADSYER